MFYPITFSDEIWVDLNLPPIKKNLYSISNYGGIRNKCSGNFLSIIKDRYLSTQLMNEDNTRSTYRIHRLVAEMFVPKTEFPEYDIYVNHKDLDKWNPHVNNLEWITPEGNVEHAWRNGAHDSDFDNDYRFNQTDKTNNWGRGDLTAGEKNGMARLTTEQVHSICKNVEAGCNYGSALLNSGLENTENNRFLVSHIVQGTRWQSVASQYKLKQQKVMTDYTPYIRNVCKMLSEGHTVRQIVEGLNLPGDYEKARGFAGRIKRREVYPEISNSYNW